jgi:hypothetical protein
MQGKEVDMEKLVSANELMPAVGNVRVNARGDELGPGGQIIRKREEVMAEYYESNPKAQPDVVKPVSTKAPTQATQPKRNK